MGKVLAKAFVLVKEFRVFVLMIFFLKACLWRLIIYL